MKKMIFMATACLLGNSLLSQNVAADTFATTTNAVATPAAGTNTGTAAPNSGANASASSSQTSVASQNTVTNNVPPAVTVTTSAPTPKRTKPSCWLHNLSGDLTFATNYVFRGISRTENIPAIQADVIYQFPIGFYLKAWGSNIKFSGSDAILELDAIGGLQGNLTENLHVNLFLDQYNFLGAAGLSYLEFNSIFNYKIVEFGYSYAPRVYGQGQGRYYYAGINYDVPPQCVFPFESVSVHATIGHWTLPKEAGNSYNNYSAWVSKGFKKYYTFTVQWTDTNGRNKNSYSDSHIFALLDIHFN